MWLGLSERVPSSVPWKFYQKYTWLIFSIREELAELRKSFELCPNDLPKYTWKDVGEELAELQEGAELCPLKILPKVYLVIFAIW